jgi:N-acetylneuraminate lyase/4-hydroxy-tetrahydrodipicolinate synthase
MTRKPFVGVIPPVLTLFTKCGQVDEQAQREFLEFLVQKGVHALFVSGTYGAGILMTMEQRKKLFDLTMDQVGGRIPVIAHVGAADTDTAVELAQYAESKGADAVAAIPPFYFPHSERSVIAHYTAIVQSVKVPVFAYNNPKASGILITPNMAVELGKNGLAGMKDSCFDIVAFVHTKDKTEAAGLDFEMIIGTEALWCPAAAAGAKAMVAGLANVCPELVVDYYVATVEKGIEAAAAMQPKVLRARELMKIGPTIPTCHAMLELRGIKAGLPKMPFLPLDAEQKAKVKAAMEKEGLL